MTLKTLLLKSPGLMALCAAVYRLFGFNGIRIKGKENVIYQQSGFVRQTKFKLLGNRNSVIIGPYCHISNCRFFISGCGNMMILHERVTADGSDFYMEDDGGVIEIGAGTVINAGSHLACIEGTHLTLGRDCLLSSDVVIRTGDSHALVDQNGVRINASRDVTLGDRVWAGHRVTFLKGSGVGSDSVAATNAVVTKLFTESNIVIGGNPAAVIRREITWAPERKTGINA
ncbi:hypothetical protein AAFA46_06575 [Oscillospiraceae bacterium WX1]